MTNAIAKVNYSHDAMIDLIVAQPQISQRELAGRFGYTESWVSRVMSSDSFKTRLAARREEIVNPALIHTVEEGLEALARQSLSVLQQKLETNPTGELATKALDISTRALGYGAKQQNVGEQHNYLIMMPEKAATSEEWVAGRQQRPPIDVLPEARDA